MVLLLICSSNNYFCFSTLSGPSASEVHKLGREDMVYTLAHLTMKNKVNTDDRIELERSLILCCTKSTVPAVSQVKALIPERYFDCSHAKWKTSEQSRAISHSGSRSLRINYYKYSGAERITLRVYIL